MSQEWYYSVDGDRQGPITSAELKKLADGGKVGPADLVWKEGMADWVAAKSIKGLFGAAAAAAGSAATGGIGAAAQAAAAKAAKNADEEMDDDGRPAVRSKRRDPEDDERPSRRGRPADDEEDERPSSRARRNRSDDDEEDDRPVRSRRGRDEDDEEDERPSRRSKGGRRRVPEDTGSKKMVAGLLGIFLGGWGVHKFYLGMTTPGIIQIVISVCTCGIGGVIGLIEGIIYLTKSDEDFHETYVVEQKGWF